MLQLNLGRAVGGIGDSGVWLDGGLIVPGVGFPGWLDDDTIAFQANGAIGQCDVFGGLGPNLSPRGAAPFFARAGVWAGWLSGEGVRTSWGLLLSSAYPLGLDADGALYVIADYQSGQGLACYLAGTLSPRWIDATAQPQAGQFDALTGGRCIWADGANRLQTSGLPAPAQIEAMSYAPALVDAGPDGIWLIETTNPGRTVLHPLSDATRGFVVAAQNAFGAVGWCPAPGVIEVVYAGNLGEAGPLTRTPYTLANAQPFTAAPPPHRSPDPIPVPSPSPVPVPAPAPRPVLVPVPAPSHPQPTQEMTMLAFSQKQLGSEPVPQLTEEVEVVADKNGLSALKYPDGSGYASYWFGAWKKAADIGPGERFTVNGATISAHRPEHPPTEPATTVYPCSTFNLDS